MYVSGRQNNPVVYSAVDRRNTPSHSQNIFYENLYETDFDAGHPEASNSNSYAVPVTSSPREQREPFITEPQNTFEEEFEVVNNTYSRAREKSSYDYRNVWNNEVPTGSTREAHNIPWGDCQRNYSAGPERRISDLQYEPLGSPDNTGRLHDMSQNLYDGPTEQEKLISDSAHAPIANFGKGKNVVGESQNILRVPMSKRNCQGHIQENRQNPELINEPFSNSAHSDERRVNSGSSNVSNNVLRKNRIDSNVQQDIQMSHTEISNMTASQPMNKIGFVQPGKPITDHNQTYFSRQTNKPCTNSKSQRDIPTSISQNTLRKKVQDPHMLYVVQEERPTSSERYESHHNVPESTRQQRRPMTAPQPSFSKTLQEPCTFQQDKFVAPQQHTYRNRMHEPNVFYDNEMNRERHMSEGQHLSGPRLESCMIEHENQTNTLTPQYQSSTSQPLHKSNASWSKQGCSSVIHPQNSVQRCQIPQPENTSPSKFQTTKIGGNVQPEVNESYSQRKDATASRISHNTGQFQQETQNVHPPTNGVVQIGYESQRNQSQNTFTKTFVLPNKPGHYQKVDQDVNQNVMYGNPLQGPIIVDHLEQGNQIPCVQNICTRLVQKPIQNGAYLQEEQNFQSQSSYRNSLQQPYQSGNLAQERQIHRAVNVCTTHLQEPTQSRQFQEGSPNEQSQTIYGDASQDPNNVSQFTQGNQIDDSQNAYSNVFYEPNIRPQIPQSSWNPNNNDLSRNTFHGQMINGHNQPLGSSQLQAAFQRTVQEPTIFGQGHQGSYSHNYRNPPEEPCVRKQFNQRSLSTLPQNCHQNTLQEPNTSSQVHEDSQKHHSQQTYYNNNLREPNVNGHFQQENNRPPPQSTYTKPPRGTIIAGHAQQGNQSQPSPQIYGHTSQQPNIVSYTQQRIRTSSPQNTDGNLLQIRTVCEEVQTGNTGYALQNIPRNISQQSNNTSHVQRRKHTHSSQNTNSRLVQEPHRVDQEEHARRNPIPINNNIKSLQRSEHENNHKKSNKKSSTQTIYRNASPHVSVVQIQQDTRKHNQNDHRRTSHGSDVIRHKQQGNKSQTTTLQTSQGQQSSHKHRPRNTDRNELQENTIIEHRRQIPHLNKNNNNHNRSTANYQTLQSNSSSQPQNTYQKRTQESTITSQVPQRNQISHMQNPYQSTLRETTTIISQDNHCVPLIRTKQSIINTVQRTNSKTFEQVFVSEPCMVTEMQRVIVPHFSTVLTKALQETNADMNRQQARLMADSRNLYNTLNEQVIREGQPGNVQPRHHEIVRTTLEPINNLSRHRAILVSSSHSFYKRVQETLLNDHLL